MRWSVDEAKKYELQKEFVDTALIPVGIFSLKVSEQRIVEQNWLEEVCLYAEQQLMGRVMLFPAVLMMDENATIPHLQNTPFRHLIFVCSSESIRQRLKESGYETVHFMEERKGKPYELSEVVKEGKKLTELIMGEWKKQ